MVTGKTHEGFIYSAVAYGLWGLMPLYLRALDRVAPLEILAQRIIWSVVFLALLVAVGRRWQDLRQAFTKPSIRWPLLLSALLVACNWLLYITAVDRLQVVQGSLGYFINPLVNVLLGMLFFRERLRPLQWLAVALACAGVAELTRSVGEFPWLAVALGFSFGFYGLCRKKIPVDGLVGLSVETLFLLPMAAAYALFLAFTGQMKLGAVDRGLDLLILCSGVVTAVPLVCFGQAARRLPLSTLGFLQYVSPTVQFLLAVLLFDEFFDGWRLASFSLIWAGLAAFSVDSVRHFRRTAAERRDPPVALPD